MKHYIEYQTQKIGSDTGPFKMDKTPPSGLSSSPATTLSSPTLPVNSERISAFPRGSAATAPRAQEMMGPMMGSTRLRIASTSGEMRAQSSVERF